MDKHRLVCHNTSCSAEYHYPYAAQEEKPSPPIVKEIPDDLEFSHDTDIDGDVVYMSLYRLDSREPNAPLMSNTCLGYAYEDGRPGQGYTWELADGRISRSGYRTVHEAAEALLEEVMKRA